MNKLIERYPGISLATLFVFATCADSLFELFFATVGL